MKKHGVTLLLGLWLLISCSNVEPEVKATVLSFDASRASCGGSWQIQIQGEQEVRRVLGYEALPGKFQPRNTDIWLKYGPNSEQVALGYTQCNFIKIVSIRKR